MTGEAGARVLVVDDDDDLRTLVATVLEDEGYRVESARNGVEALEIVARAMPELVLLDMKMPVLDGAGFARELRARFGNAARVVVLTAADDVLRCAEEVSADASLGKPFDIDALIEVVRRQLGR